MSYRKAKNQYEEISLCLTCSTYHNAAGKKETVSMNHTALISIKYTTYRLSAAEVSEGAGEKKKTRKFS